MLKRILPIFFILLLSASAQADKTSGDLNEKCSKIEKAPNDQNALIPAVYCAAYINGVVDGYRIMSDLYPQTRFICFPNQNISNRQAIDIFQKWLKKNPKNISTTSRSGVLLSLKEAYPCRKK